MSEAAARADDYRIEVRSYELQGATPFTKPAVHNELVFLHNNKVVAAFNGDPYHRDSGENAYPSLTNKDTLRASVYLDGTTRTEDPRNPYRVTATGVVFSGSREEFAEKLGQAVDAAHSINNSNIDYVMLSLGFTPQNSNSTVGTLLSAMGLQPPASLQGVWSPGAGRLLIPNDFRSDFTGLTAANPNWLNEDTPERRTLIERMEKLQESAVKDKVRSDPDPYAGACTPGSR